MVQKNAGQGFRRKDHSWLQSEKLISNSVIKDVTEINFCSDLRKSFLSIQDIFKQATEDRLTSANELPYFEGDFWPNVLEESIKELEQEEEERKKEENTASTETTEVSKWIHWHTLINKWDEVEQSAAVG